MTDLETILANIRKAVSDYETKQLGLLSEQSDIARDLAVNLFFLTDYKIEAFKKWNSAFFNSTLKSDEKKQAEAHQTVPEYFLICQVEKAGMNVCSILRTTISANK